MATHVLLPSSSLVRRADLVEIVGSGLELAAAGWGHRRIADRLDRPVSTVRGWLRCWSRRAGRVAGVFTLLLVDLADDPSVVLPAPAASLGADAVAAVAGFALAAGLRFGMATVPIWTLASAACHGRLLAPGWPAPVR
uniref:helix-turn-helix domain-containing protein n=1 Tax=Kitasatospora indigofera TaxID=67307 RepID=UPI002F90B22E